MSDLLTGALDYAARGLPVFPCLPHGKAPAVPRGFLSATTNPATIRRFWTNPECNVAIPTGARSGFWALDVDGAELKVDQGTELPHAFLKSIQGLLQGGTAFRHERLRAFQIELGPRFGAEPDGTREILGGRAPMAELPALRTFYTFIFTLWQDAHMKTHHALAKFDTL